MAKIKNWQRHALLAGSLLSFGVAAQTCNPSITASTPTANFQIHGDGTVTDTQTGLMWKQCVEGQSGSHCANGSAATLTWQEALQVAETLNVVGGFAGYTDWRLPNIKELLSIVEVQCDRPAINLGVFPREQNLQVWSGSPSPTEWRGPGDNPFALTVIFTEGYGSSEGRRSTYPSVWLVRSAQ